MEKMLEQTKGLQEGKAFLEKHPHAKNQALAAFAKIRELSAATELSSLEVAYDLMAAVEDMDVVVAIKDMLLTMEREMYDQVAQGLKMWSSVPMDVLAEIEGKTKALEVIKEEMTIHGEAAVKQFVAAEYRRRLKEGMGISAPVDDEVGDLYESNALAPSHWNPDGYVRGLVSLVPSLEEGLQPLIQAMEPLNDQLKGMIIAAATLASSTPIDATPIDAETGMEEERDPCPPRKLPQDAILEPVVTQKECVEAAMEVLFEAAPNAGAAPYAAHKDPNSPVHRGYLMHVGQSVSPPTKTFNLSKIAKGKAKHLGQDGLNIMLGHLAKLCYLSNSSGEVTPLRMPRGVKEWDKVIRSICRVLAGNSAPRGETHEDVVLTLLSRAPLTTRQLMSASPSSFSALGKVRVRKILTKMMSAGQIHRSNDPTGISEDGMLWHKGGGVGEPPDHAKHPFLRNRLRSLAFAGMTLEELQRAVMNQHGIKYNFVELRDAISTLGGYEVVQDEIKNGPAMHLVVSGKEGNTDPEFDSPATLRVNTGKAGAEREARIRALKFMLCLRTSSVTLRPHAALKGTSYSRNELSEAAAELEREGKVNIKEHGLEKK
jgi:hypothetical protein